MKKKKKAPTVRRRITTALFLAVALAFFGTIGYALVLARIVHVERVIISAPDLPEAFDGIRILYISDIDITGFTTPGGAARLMNHLARLKPDVLILGGDYACDSLLDELNGTGSEPELAEARRKFFSALKGFDAPMGKFAVAGENDANALNLAAELSLGGISLLSDSEVAVESGGQKLAIVGLSDYSAGKTDYGKIAQQFSHADYVIVAAHNPSSIGGVVTAEAGDSGAWCDLMLTGHNHGGQAVLFGRTMLKLSEIETRFLSGWHKESGTQVLVSEGLGCDTVNLRLGTQAQVHLITLRRGTTEQ